MARPETLSKFDNEDIERIGERLHQSLFLGQSEFSLARHPQPNYDRYDESGLIPEYYWTLTAVSPDENVCATMIVRGSSWTQVDGLWFTVDGKDYVCRFDVIRQSESLKNLEKAFKLKAAEIHNKVVVKEFLETKKAEDNKNLRLKQEAEGIVSSLQRTISKFQKPS